MVFSLIATTSLQFRCLADKGVITTTAFRKAQAKFMERNLCQFVDGVFLTFVIDVFLLSMKSRAKLSQSAIKLLGQEQTPLKIKIH